MRILYLQMAGRTPYLMTQLVVWGSGGLRVGYQTSQQGRPELSSRMYDGEYCQVHISLDISGADIHIFLKERRRFDWGPRRNSSSSARQPPAWHDRLRDREAVHLKGRAIGVEQRSWQN
jgi:hypothetical protein